MRGGDQSVLVRPRALGIGIDLVPSRIGRFPTGEPFVIFISFYFRLMLPPGFVYLSQVCNSILQDIRYSGCENFTGAKVEGYNSGVAILTEVAAGQLALVQKELESNNFGLLVFDAYRPKRAVDSLIISNKIRGITKCI